MNPPTAPAAISTTRVSPAPRRHRGLFLAQAGWVAVALLALATFTAMLPVRYHHLHQATPSVRHGLNRLNLTVTDYARFTVGLDLVFVLVFGAVGLVIFGRRRDDLLALLASLMLITMGVQFPIQALADTRGTWQLPIQLLTFLAWVSFLTLFYVFPNGRFIPRWTRPFALVFALAEAPYDIAALHTVRLPSLLAGIAWIGWIATGIFAQIYRYRRVSDPTERQQTKWVAFGMVAAIAGSLLFTLPGELVPSLQRAGSPYDLASDAVFDLLLLLIPLSFGVAILRYRLWDIDVVINRTLVYGSLTACVIGLYVLVVGYLGTLLRTGGNLAISLIATGLIAVLFQPLRGRLQHTVNRLMYGERDDPYAVLARLGQRLEAALAPDTVLATITETVAEALKLPYAAIALAQDGDQTVAASSGSPTRDPLRLPLTYQNEAVGELILGPRAPGEAFSGADLRLLGDLARQAGIAAHAVRLVVDLQHARELLVTAREDERRRLRRDLHDGLGPQLGSLLLKLGVADDLVELDPAAAHALLAGLKTQTQTAMADVRRLVYALRPPALDDLGLVAALREAATDYGPAGPQMTVEAPEPLPPLPAAVEVAVFRIAQEALTNTLRHAGAQICSIRLTLDAPATTLTLDVIDNGCGIDPRRRQGIGLSSMRERAEELGGTCDIITRPEGGGGTHVCARLPL